MKTVMATTATSASRRSPLVTMRERRERGGVTGATGAAAAASLGFFNRDLVDLDRRRRALVRVARRDGHEHVHAFDYLPEDGVLVVEPGRGHVRDEELRAVGAGPGVRHREHAALAVLQAGVEFVRE